MYSKVSMIRSVVCTDGAIWMRRRNEEEEMTNIDYGE